VNSSRVQNAISKIRPLRQFKKSDVDDDRTIIEKKIDKVKSSEYAHKLNYPASRVAEDLVKYDNDSGEE
jgi:hypothetical protein